MPESEPEVRGRARALAKLQEIHPSLTESDVRSPATDIAIDQAVHLLRNEQAPDAVIESVVEAVAIASTGRIRQHGASVGLTSDEIHQIVTLFRWVWIYWFRPR